MTKIENMIKEMLKMQQTLNDKTNGEGWEHGKTKDGINIHWKRYIHMECSELINSYPYAHWKYLTVPADYNNVTMEVVDIFHFLASDLLADATVAKLNSIHNSTQKLIMGYNRAIEFTKNVDLENSIKDQDRIIYLTEDVMKSVLRNDPLDVIARRYFMLALHTGLKIEDLYKLYMGKNVLNIFRQDNEYKKGEYIKIWDGEEDNDYLHKLLDENEEVSADALYEKLQARYNVIKAMN